MTDITINTHDLRTVSFDGVLIDQQSTHVRLSDQVEALIVLRLFAVDGGGLVPVVEFSSASPHVDDVIDAERVDLIKDVECFFLLFEPTEHVEFGADAIESRTPIADQRFRQTLMRTYYGMVDKILDTLADYHASHPSCEVIPAQRSDERSRIWNFFGLGKE